MSITVKNNFDFYKNDFKKDTDLDAKTNMALYIQYFNARTNDYSMQVLSGLTNQLLNELDRLPSKIRLEMADMLRSHEVIKQLLKK